VKDAPKIDTDGHLSPEEEQELYRYYGMGGGQTTGQTTGETTGRTTGQTTGETTGRITGQTTGETTGRTTDTADYTRSGTAETTTNTGMGAGMTDRTGDTTGAGFEDRNRHGTRGHDTSGPTTDDAMTLSEERVNVGTQQVEAGRARLRKYVVTENVTQTVPVSHEEVRVEREPITDANRGSAMDGPAISEEEHEVTLQAERPVVEKEAVPVERVRLGTETVTEQQQVNETVRKEAVDTDGVTTAGTGTGTVGRDAGDNRSLKDKAKDALSRDDDRR